MDFMDYDHWDLWGPPFYPASPETSHCLQNEWQCDFYFGYGTDVMEEDAINEKSCIKVLRMLITKADTEIDELEKDLVSHQSELAWFECEEWDELCCGALRERIEDFNILMRDLRNTDKNEIEVNLRVHTETIATIHEILNALLTKHLEEKHNQEQQSSAKEVIDTSSHTPVYATEFLDDSSRVSDSCSDVTRKERKESGDSPAEHHKILCMSSELQEKKVSDAQTNKPVRPNIKDSSTDSLKSATDLLTNLKSKSTVNAVAEEPSTISEENEIIKDLSLKLADEKRHIIESVQPGIEQVVNHSNEKQILRNSFVKIKSEEMEENNSIHALNAVLTKIDPWENSKLANSYENNSSGALRHATGLNTRKENSDSWLGAFRQADMKQNLARDQETKIASKVQKSHIAANGNKSNLEGPEPQKEKMNIKAGDLNDMVIKRLMQPVRFDSKEHGAVLQNSFLRPEKKRKDSISPISAVKAEELSVQIDCSNSPRTAMCQAVKEPLNPDFFSVGDVDMESVKPFLQDAANLRRLRMDDLKAMAKKLNLTRYYKLKKDALIELLISRLGSC